MQPAQPFHQQNPTPKVEYPVLLFQKNWNNKLDNCFYTSIRLHNYNRYQPGAVFNVHLNKKYIHSSVIVDVKALHLHQITDWHAYLDAAMSAVDLQTMLKNMYNKYTKGKADQCLYHWILFQRL